jgi:hypothetical protein
MIREPLKRAYNLFKGFGLGGGWMVCRDRKAAFFILRRRGVSARERDMYHAASVEAERLAAKLTAEGYELHKVEVCGEPRDLCGGMVSVPLTVTVLRYVQVT